MVTDTQHDADHYGQILRQCPIQLLVAERIRACFIAQLTCDHGPLAVARASQNDDYRFLVAIPIPTRLERYVK